MKRQPVAEILELIMNNFEFKLSLKHRVGYAILPHFQLSEMGFFVGYKPFKSIDVSLKRRLCK